MFPHDPAPKGEVQGEREIRERLELLWVEVWGGGKNEEFWVDYIG